MVVTSVSKKEVATSFSSRDIISKREKVATSFSSRDISCTERRSRHHSVVATSLQGIKVATSLSSRDNRSKERGRDIIQRSRHPPQRPEGRDIIQWSRHHSMVATSNTKRLRRHLAVATSDPRNAKDKSRPNKSLCDITETTEVATKNRGCDINNKIGQLT